ncbi:hypothetical protein [Streptococcus australis]|uniref:hypothetical protein n=1 Tax=Streptococcus australis TaxID=113107 RepID=UPI0005BC79B1|nr:hypothetical protein [Streptococcus australis]
MEKIIIFLLLLIMPVIMIACSKSNRQSLDGEYYWISSERNELAFTIKGNRGSIEHGEADSFIIDQENNTFHLSGEGTTDSTVKYKVKDGIITVDISGIEHEYYQKGSKAYNKALQQYK